MGTCSNVVNTLDFEVAGAVLGVDKAGEEEDQNENELVHDVGIIIIDQPV